MISKHLSQKITHKYSDILEVLVEADIIILESGCKLLGNRKTRKTASFFSIEK